MKTLKRSVQSSILVLLFLTLCCCSPSIRKGELIQTGMEQTGKFWKTQNVTFTGDTMVLEQENAQVISKFKSQDFTFTATLFTTAGAEGRLVFHTGNTGGDTLKGYMVVINNSDYRSGNSQKTGSLSYIRNNFLRTASDDKWFKLKVSVEGNHIIVSVDGKIISEYIEPVGTARAEGFEEMKLSKGRIALFKTNNKGKILLAGMDVEIPVAPISAAADTAFVNDSIGEMLTLFNQQLFPLIDYHGHLKGGLTVDQICQHGRVNGYNYGVAPNCGLFFPVTNDSALNANYDNMLPEPVFKAMQCEGREWVTLFSPEAVARYDYIFTDAMTWTDHKGRRMRLWMPDETVIENDQQFMEMLVGKIEAVLSKEPVDIYVNPTFLPAALAASYDSLWTPERMDRVIKALVTNDVALEINSRFRIPSLEFVKRAKAAGVKFTAGTNNAGNNDLGRLEYSMDIIKKAGITPEDMFIPRPAGDKKVTKMGLPSKVTG